MILGEKQKLSIREAIARINLWCGAVRSGKTIASLIRWAQFVGRAESDFDNLMMVGKTEITLRHNVIEPLEWLVGSRNFSYSIGAHEGRLFGRKVLFFGANDERAEGKIRGLTSGGAYGDEVTLWPGSFWNMMLSRCSSSGAKIFGTTNTDSPFHWLKKSFIDRSGVLNLRQWSFTIEDNPGLSREYVESLRNEYVGVYFSRFILGLWAAAEGLIFDFFEEATPYVIKEHPPALYHYVGVDYGTQNACTFGLMGVNPYTKPKIWTEREYWHSGRDTGRQKTDSEYADDMKGFLGKIRPREIICDPSARSFMNELRARGYPVEEADNAVLDGIRVHQKMLKSGDYAICEGCTNTIKEYFSYVWDPRAQQRGLDQPLKQDDHSKDRERYVLKTKFGEPSMDYDTFTSM